MPKTSNGYDDINLVVVRPQAFIAISGTGVGGALAVQRIEDVLYVDAVTGGKGGGKWLKADAPPKGNKGLLLLAGKDRLTAYLGPRPVETKVIMLDSDLFKRQKGVFETRILKSKLVTIIGLGSGGSFAAVELAKCGVERFRLIDFDRLETHNVSRHACGISSVGRFKTHCVRDAILEKNPEAVVETLNFDVLKDDARLEGALIGSHIVLVCTDTERSRLAINAHALKLKVPAVYAGAYERAFGGDVIRVIPGETPCYDCVIGAVKKNLEDLPRQKVVDYSNLSDPADFRAEPGLGLDIDFITLLQVKMALLTLLRGENTTLKDLDTNFIMWSNRAEWIFKEPLQAIFANTSVREDCATCQGDKLVEKRLAMDHQQIEESARDILEQTRKRSGGGT